MLAIFDSPHTTVSLLRVGMHARVFNNIPYITFALGWGRVSSAGAMANVLQQAEIPIVSDEICQAKNNPVSEVDSWTMLCGGYDNKKTSGCKGKSLRYLDQRTIVGRGQILYVWSIIVNSSFFDYFRAQYFNSYLKYTKMIHMRSTFAIFLF